MTSTRAINAAAGVIHACLQQGKTLPATQAYALDSAGLLNSPEIAAELLALRARVVELEAQVSGARPVDEDPIAYALTEQAAAVAPVPRRAESVAKLRELLARQTVDPCDILTLAPAQHVAVSYDQAFQTIDLELTATSEQWAAWQTALDVDLARTTNRGGCVTSHASWRGAHVVICCWFVRERVEDPHNSPLHHDYTGGRDLPEVTP